jgi:ketosteroid isomerase-like protein
MARGGQVKVPARMSPSRDVSRPDYYGNPSGVTNDIDVVRAIYAAFAARDLDRAVELLSPDCELHLRGTQDLIGREEPYRGHAGMREYYDDVARTWEELTLFANDFRAIPGAVVVMGHVEGRIDGEPVRRGAVWTWKVRAGKATEVRVADLGPAA